MSRACLAAAVLLPLACDQSLTPRAEGIPLAPGEEREAAPTWRLREGLVASTVVESGEPLTRNMSPGAPRLPSRLDGMNFWGDGWHSEPGDAPRLHGRPERGFLWIDHGESGSWLRVERDAEQEWALTLSSSNTTHDVAHAGTVTPWGTLWNTTERARDWRPDETEAGDPVPGPAGCQWERFAFALDQEGELTDGAPIVMYALAANVREPFKLVTKGVYDARLPQGKLLALLANAQLFKAAGERHAAAWTEAACPSGAPSTAPARDLDVALGTQRLFFSTGVTITMLEEKVLDRAQSRRFASTTLVRQGRNARAPMVSDADGALWFASGSELFYLDAASEGAEPERLATAPGGGVIVGMAWNADESSLFLGLQDGVDRASVVALSAR